MSPIYQVKCPECGKEDEVITNVDNRETACRFCSGGRTARVPAVRGPGLANEDTPWVRSVLEVVDKESKAPHVVEFLKNPTRSNMRAWMKKEGIRHWESGEKPRKFEFDESRHAEKVMEMKIRRERYEIRG
jgi:hypothetical protein